MLGYKAVLHCDICGIVKELSKIHYRRDHEKRTKDWRFFPGDEDISDNGFSKCWVLRSYKILSPRWERLVACKEHFSELVERVKAENSDNVKVSVFDEGEFLEPKKA